MKKISVIIPVYNTSKYLNKCLNSVINQGYSNYEIIVVNDGSTDNSDEIVKDFIEQCGDKIKYFEKENGGLSDARNYGVKQATGDYICFIDSDDYIDDELFNTVYDGLECEYDLVKYKLAIVDENYKFIEKVDGPVFENETGEDAFNLLYCTDVMLQPAWLYMYRRDFWMENNFEYPVGKLHEDFALTSLVMLKAKSVKSIDFVGYYYVQSASSITRGNSQEKKIARTWDLLEHYDVMIDKIKSYELKNETISNLKTYYTNCIILKLEELDKENRKKFLIEIKKRKMFSNIKVKNIKQLIKRALLNINIDWYFKLR